MVLAFFQGHKKKQRRSKGSNAVFYGDDDSVDRKVRSAVFTAEMRDEKLWGVAECRVTGELTEAELDRLKRFTWRTILLYPAEKAFRILGSGGIFSFNVFSCAGRVDLVRWAQSEVKHMTLSIRKASVGEETAVLHLLAVAPSLSLMLCSLRPDAAAHIERVAVQVDAAGAGARAARAVAVRQRRNRLLSQHDAPSAGQAAFGCADRAVVRVPSRWMKKRSANGPNAFTLFA